MSKRTSLVVRWDHFLYLIKLINCTNAPFAFYITEAPIVLADASLSNNIPRYLNSWTHSIATPFSYNYLSGSEFPKYIALDLVVEITKPFISQNSENELKRS